MNPLTLVKRIQNINKQEANLGLSEEASWHAKYKDSAYVFVGGVPFDLTEGDLLAVFAQYGEIVDVNLVRDKGTGKSKGFAFIAYEDQRSTILAVDNLNGAQILGRIIRVDHVTRYKKLEEEDEETKQQKRRNEVYAVLFRKENVIVGDSCKFSHDEQRAANTGWGAEEDRPLRWAKDKPMMDGRSGRPSDISGPAPHNGTGRERSYEGAGSSFAKDRRVANKHLDPKDTAAKHKDVYDGSSADKRLRSSDGEPNSKEEGDRRDDKRSRKYEPEPHHREDRCNRERDSRSGHDRDSSRPHHRRDRDE